MGGAITARVLRLLARRFLARRADGKSIPPTNKKFKLEVVTIGHWKDGVMLEEWLMWDNQAFMKQIGAAN